MNTAAWLVLVCFGWAAAFAQFGLIVRLRSNYRREILFQRVNLLAQDRRIGKQRELIANLTVSLEEQRALVRRQDIGHTN